MAETEVIPEDLLNLSAEDLDAINKATLEEITRETEKLGVIIRALNGQGTEDHISLLTNAKNIFERTRLPSYPILLLVTYLRNVHHLFQLEYPTNNPAKMCLKWAENLAEGLISYKGLGREEYVEMTKNANAPQQEFIIGSNQLKPEESQPKRGFLHRRQAPKQEESEFKE